MTWMSYPPLWWLAVGVSSGAGAVVLIGLGYLAGRRAAEQMAAQAVARVREELEAASAARVQRTRSWGGL